MSTRAENHSPPVDVAIVGAGPIGLELAIALRHHGVSLRHFEAGSIGRTIVGYPRETRFFSSPERIAIAGIPLSSPRQEKTTREEYLAYLRSLVAAFSLEVETQRTVVSIEPRDGRFVVGVAPSIAPPPESPPLPPVDRGAPIEEVDAGRVILAIGDMHDAHAIGIPGEDAPHVSHFFHEPHAYCGRSVLIVGGKNSAVEAALRCHRAGARVHLSYRGAELPERSVKAWLLPDIRNQIRSGGIAFSPETIPVAIEAAGARLRGVTTGEESVHPADFVLLLTGYDQSPALFRAAGIDVEGPLARPVLDPETMESTTPGVFVAGTAVAGSQRSHRVFIENSHPHVARIVRAITGREPPFTTDDTSLAARDLPES